MASKELNVVVIADPMGHGFGEVSPEQEMQDTLEKYADLLRPAKFNVFKSTILHPAQFPFDADLLLYDYGGMGAGMSGLIDSNTRTLLKWCEEHPSSLVVVTSSFCFRTQIKDELEESGLALHNIVSEDYDLDEYSFSTLPAGWPIPEWFRVFHNLPVLPIRLKRPSMKNMLVVPGKVSK